jgi:predicted amidophosphoribosyltransferase
MTEIKIRERKVLGYLHNAYLRCPQCAKPWERAKTIYEGDEPYCDETCDRCGRKLDENSETP